MVLRISKDEIVDRIDVPPGFGGRIDARLDHIEINAIRPEISAAQQSDDPGRARAGVKKRVAQPGALGRAHRSIVEIEREIANLILLGINDLTERAIIGWRIDRQWRLRHAAKQRSQDLRRRQLDPGDRKKPDIAEPVADARLGEAGLVLGLQMGDPDGAIDCADADRAVAPGQNLAGGALEALLLMHPVEVASFAKQRAEDARSTVRRADLSHDHRRIVPHPVDGTVGLPHRWAQTTAHIWRLIGQLLGTPGAGPELPRFDPGDRFKHTAQGGLGDLTTIEAALRGRICLHGKLMRGPNCAGIELVSCFQDRHAPATFRRWRWPSRARMAPGRLGCRDAR